MTVDRLNSVLGKINRAYTHELDLRRIEQAIEERCHNAVLRYHEGDTGEYVFRILEVPAIPDEYALILGDAIHNLRASLDHLAVALTTAQTGAWNANTSFPVLTARPTASKRGASLPQLNPPVPLAVRQALDQAQPYSDPHSLANWLHVAHRLDITDKHRRIIVSAVQRRSVRIDDLSLPRWKVLYEASGPVKDGDVLVRAVPESDSVPDFYPGFPISVQLAEEEIKTLSSIGGSTVVLNIALHLENRVLPLFRPFL